MFLKSILVPLLLTFLTLCSVPAAFAQSSGPSISNITTNASDYSGSLVPKYEKFEVTFDITNTMATNFQLPYDANPPADPSNEINTGITVDAQFSLDNFQTIYTQPAFYYQEFDYQQKNNMEWIYPTLVFKWKVRFAPPKEGTWQFRLKAEDASGTTTSVTQSFSVISSTNKGFIRVSNKDNRYFEFEDGTYFPGLGYNMNYNHVNWRNPILDNQNNFSIMGQNGIQLIRIWLSEWSIYGSAWNPWISPRGDYGGYIPRTGMDAFTPSPNEPRKMTLALSYVENGTSRNTGWYDACRMVSGFEPRAPLKRHTNYQVSVIYYSYNISGPRNVAYPNYGFVVKMQNPNDGNWHTNCYDATVNNSTGLPITSYAPSSSGWTTLEGTWNSGSRDFMPPMYLGIENTNALDPSTNGRPYVFVESVKLREVLSDGNLGPDVLPKSSMAHHLYFAQRNSYAFDKVVELAKQNAVYLRPVVLEKGEDIFRKIDYNGNWASDTDNYFYGNWRNMNKTRWLQQAWWRYLQARWGYSTNIQSWELLNEGNPFSEQHYILADEMGKYMRQFSPNHHLISTSNWHSFPRDQFWGNANYPNVDFADIHYYVVEGSDTNFNDTAQSTASVSNSYGAKRPGGANKPIIRGETGFVTGNSDGWNHEYFNNDTQGIWLHKYIWGQINPGGLIESYWYEDSHIYPSGRDLRPLYKQYYDFIKDIPLSNGNYVDAAATPTDTNLRVWGQKDPVNGKAHLWIDNRNHTWRNVVNLVSITPAGGNISFSGMPAGSYTVSWYDTYSGSTLSTTSINVDSSGIVNLNLPSSISSDIAVKIDTNTSQLMGDVDGNNIVDQNDVSELFLNWINTINQRADVNRDGKVNTIDFLLVLRGWN